MTRNIEALQNLRRVVEAAPDELLEMSSFTNKTDCGTTHCAAGWFAIDRWAQQNTTINRVINENGEPIYGTYDIRFELSGIFELSHKNVNTAFYIMSGTWNIGDPPIPKSAVLANIDRLLAGQDAVPYSEIMEVVE